MPCDFEASSQKLRSARSRAAGKKIQGLRFQRLPRANRGDDPVTHHDGFEEGIWDRWCPARPIAEMPSASGFPERETVGFGNVDGKVRREGFGTMQESDPESRPGNSLSPSAVEPRHRHARDRLFLKTRPFRFPTASLAAFIRCFELRLQASAVLLECLIELRPQFSRELSARASAHSLLPLAFQPAPSRRLSSRPRTAASSRLRNSSSSCVRALSSIRPSSADSPNLADPRTLP